MMVMPGEYHDEPTRRAQQRHCADPAGQQRVNVNDNAFARS
jgi:hypothetical protein